MYMHTPFRFKKNYIVDRGKSKTDSTKINLVLSHGPDPLNCGKPVSFLVIFSKQKPRRQTAPSISIFYQPWPPLPQWWALKTAVFVWVPYLRAPYKTPIIEHSTNTILRQVFPIFLLSNGTSETHLGSNPCYSVRQ